MHGYNPNDVLHLPLLSTANFHEFDSDDSEHTESGDMMRPLVRHLVAPKLSSLAFSSADDCDLLALRQCFEHLTVSDSNPPHRVLYHHQSAFHLATHRAPFTGRHHHPRHLRGRRIQCTACSPILSAGKKDITKPSPTSFPRSIFPRRVWNLPKPPKPDAS